MAGWFMNSSIRRKLEIGLGVMMLFIIIIAGVGLNSVSNINGEITAISKAYLPGINFLLQLDRDLYQSVLAQQTLVTTPKTSPDFADLVKDHSENIEQVKERWEKFKKCMEGQLDQNAFTAFESKFKAWETETKSISAKLQNDSYTSKEEMLAEIERSNSSFKGTREEINILTEATEKKTDESVAQSAETVSSAYRFIFLPTFLLIIGSIFLSRLMNKSIADPIKKASEIMTEFGRGKISSRMGMERKDEIGILSSSVDGLAENLSVMVGILHHVADGELDAKIKPFSNEDEITPSIQKTLNSLQNLQNETNTLINAAVEGRLNTRGNANLFKGGYNKIITGFNETLDAVIKPVKESALVIERMAKGDFTAKVTGDYKGDHQILKNSINTLNDSLSDMILNVKNAIQATASASSEISSSTEEMAAGAQEQSSQATEVASAVEEMTKTIFETSKATIQAAETAKSSGSKAEDGGRVVKQTIEGMNRISEVVNQSANTVFQLGQNSERIGEIIQVIDDIADQTNLLALNAAIEAARAGEQGRGFAVVADEVRKLAERTTKATKEIAQMIKQIQNDTSQAVSSIKEGTVEVENGKKLANQAGTVLVEILQGAHTVSDVVTQVAAASEQQSATAEEIGKNIESMSLVMHETAQGVQQIAQAAEGLNRLTESLENLIRQFKVNEKHHLQSSRNYNQLQ